MNKIAEQQLLARKYKGKGKTFTLILYGVEICLIIIAFFILANHIHESLTGSTLIPICEKQISLEKLEGIRIVDYGQYGNFGGLANLKLPDKENYKLGQTCQIQQNEYCKRIVLGCE